jgi:hypothetical protein
VVGAAPLSVSGCSQLSIWASSVSGDALSGAACAAGPETMTPSPASALRRAIPEYKWMTQSDSHPEQSLYCGLPSFSGL